MCQPETPATCKKNSSVIFLSDWRTSTNNITVNNYHVMPTVENRQAISQRGHPWCHRRGRYLSECHIWYLINLKNNIKNENYILSFLWQHLNYCVRFCSRFLYASSTTLQRHSTSPRVHLQIVISIFQVYFQLLG